MTRESTPARPERVFCEMCAKPVSRAGALMAEAIDYVAYFCGSICYEKWRGDRAPVLPPHEVQGDHGRSKARDERMKQIVKQHPQRDEPRVDSVEDDELPPK